MSNEGFGHRASQLVCSELFVICGEGEKQFASQQSQARTRGRCCFGDSDTQGFKRLLFEVLVEVSGL